MSLPMRILVVSQYFWPESFRINDLVLDLVKRGHDVTVLTGKPNYPSGNIFPEFLENKAQFQNYEGAEIIRVPMISRGNNKRQLVFNYLTFAFSAATLGLWKLRKKKFDLIFTFEPSPVTVGLPAVLLRKTKRCPLIFWVQDLWPDTLVAMGVVKSNIFLNLLRKLVTFIYNHCDLILAQSKSFIPKILQHTKNKHSVKYFPNWSDITSIPKEIKIAPEVIQKSGSFNVLFAGNIGHAQDFPSILAAAERLKDKTNIRWLIVGDGSMTDWVKSEINKRGLHDQVLMLGRYPSARMPSFFAHANALLVSLRNEPIFSMTIPSKLQTYLSTGIPIVTMLNGEGSKLINESGAGLTCTAGDDKSLADAILKLSQLPTDKLKDMGNNGLLISEKEFNRAKLIDQLELWMNELARKKKL